MKGSPSSQSSIFKKPCLSFANSANNLLLSSKSRWNYKLLHTQTVHQIHAEKTVIIFLTPIVGYLKSWKTSARPFGDFNMNIFLIRRFASLIRLPLGCDFGFKSSQNWNLGKKLSLQEQRRFIVYKPLFFCKRKKFMNTTGGNNHLLD